MSLAALGCNPEHKWTITGSGQAAKVGGENPQNAVALGTFGYSPDGGVYVCIQAQGSVVQYGACVIRGAFEAAELDTGNDTLGQMICIPQVALADNEYGWGLVLGAGRVQAGANCAANARLEATGTDGRVDDTNTNNVPTIVGLQLSAARGSTAGDAPCIACWPSMGGNEA